MNLLSDFPLIGNSTTESGTLCNHTPRNDDDHDALDDFTTCKFSF